MTSPARDRLPNRRRSETLDLELAGHPYSVTIGFYADGRIGEVFTGGPKVGSSMAGLIEDASVLLSRLLQLGAEPGELAGSMGRLGDGRAPASVIGAVADLVARESGQAGAR